MWSAGGSSHVKAKPCADLFVGGVLAPSRRKGAAISHREKHLKCQVLGRVVQTRVLGRKSELIPI